MACHASQVLVTYVLFTVISVVCTNYLSFALGHVNAMLPSLSHIGDIPLESTLFTQCFVINAGVLMIINKIRSVYTLIHLRRASYSDTVLTINDVGACLGYCTAAGLFVVACFQETNAVYLHNFAKIFMYYFGSIMYFIIQSFLCKQIINDPQQFILLQVQIILNCLMLLFFAIYLGGFIIASKRCAKPWNQRHKWDMEDGGWVAHVFSTASERVLISLFLLYFITFYFDFKKVIVSGTRIKIISDSRSNSIATST